MKLTPWYLAALAPIAIAGCSGTILGHVAVLAVTIGIFFGTLSLGRVSAQRSSGRSEAPAALITPVIDVPVIPASRVPADLAPSLASGSVSGSVTGSVPAAASGLASGGTVAETDARRA